MYYVMSMTEREKPRFDAYVEGVLIDENNEIGINLFTAGLPMSERASRSYKILTDREYCETGKIRDRLVCKVHNSPIFLVSGTFKNLLDEMEQKYAEFYPVELDQVNGYPLNGYYICNLINKRDCIDYEKSELNFTNYNEFNEGYDGVYAIEHLVIDSSKVSTNDHIFLLDNVKYPVVIVSQKIKSEIENRGITGFKFVDPYEFMI